MLVSLPGDTYTLLNGDKVVLAEFDLFAHAHELLRELRDIRSSNDARQRPLIFIAHCIGGIVVKEVRC
jgi:hypothetical protein